MGAEEPKVSKVQEAISTFVTANRLKDCGGEATIRKYDEIRTERSATYLAKEKNCFKNFLGPVYRLRLWLGLNIYNTEIREHKAEIHIHCPPGPGCPLVDQTIVVSLDETKGSPVFEKTVWTTLRTIRGVQEEGLGPINFLGGALYVAAALRAFLAANNVSPANATPHPDQPTSFCGGEANLWDAVGLLEPPFPKYYPPPPPVPGHVSPR